MFVCVDVFTREKKNFVRLNEIVHKSATGSFAYCLCNTHKILVKCEFNGLAMNRVFFVLVCLFVLSCAHLRVDAFHSTLSVHMLC